MAVKNRRFFTHRRIRLRIIQMIVTRRKEMYKKMKKGDRAERRC
jgi:hypothetical protein